jgi:hypothetical protein
MTNENSEAEFNVEEEMKKIRPFMDTYNQEYGEGDIIVDNFYTWYEKLGLTRHIVPTDAELEYLDTITNEIEQCKAFVHESNYAYNKIIELRKHILIVFFISLVFLLFFKCIWIGIPSVLIFIYYLYLKKIAEGYLITLQIMLVSCYVNDQHNQEEIQKTFR